MNLNPLFEAFDLQEDAARALADDLSTRIDVLQTQLHDTTGPLRARDICEALDFELLPKHVERTRAKMKRLVTRGILSEAEPGTFSRKQKPNP
ncbi:hypothetical protein ACQ86D_00295 [Streptomyces galilaeus]